MTRILLTALAVVATCSAAVPVFEENHGQAPSSVKYLVRSPKGYAYLTGAGIALQRVGSSTPVSFTFEGASQAPTWTPETLAGRISYTIGRDQSRWVKDAPQYARLHLASLYPGIDAAFYQSAGSIEYDLNLAPGADPNRIRIRIAGATRVSIDRDGSLLAQSPDGQIRQRLPELVSLGANGPEKVGGRFVLLGRNLAGFRLAKYDRTRPLRIDPTIESTTYVGGAADENLVYSSNGYSVGNTNSIDFPGAPFERRKGTPVFIQTSSGSGVPSTTIIGGTGHDLVTSVALPNSQTYNVYFLVVAGVTDSQDLPTTTSNSGQFGARTLNAAQSVFAGGATDGFLILIPLNSNGSSLVTYFGTAGDDRINAVANAPYGIAIVGTTTGRDLPGGPTPALFNPATAAPMGGLDGFVSIQNPSPSGLQSNGTYYFGGSGDDTPLAATVINGALYVGGETTSRDFIAPGANAAPTLNGSSDAFLLRFDYSSGLSLLPKGLLFLGGGGTDRITSLSTMLDPLGLDNRLVVAGTTSSQDLALLNPVQPAYGGGNSDAFAAMMSPNFDRTFWFTYLGGAGDDVAGASVAGIPGTFIAGNTNSQDFPVSSNAVQPTFSGGNRDGFVVQLKPDGSLFQATYLGGSGDDSISSLSLGSDRTLTVAGTTTSPDLPGIISTGNSLKGNSDGFVIRLGDGQIYGTPITAVKGFRAVAGASVGPMNGIFPNALQVTSSDPSVVLLAAQAADRAQSTILTRPTPYLDSDTNRQFYVECQTDSGGADLLVQAPGYLDSIAHVSCYPAVLQPVKTSLAVSPSTSPSYIYLSLAALLPDGTASLVNATPRPDAAPFNVLAISSNPDVATLTPASVVVAPFEASFGNLFSFTFLPSTRGTATITFQSDGIPVNSTVNITVNQVYSTYRSSLPGGFQKPLYFFSANQLPFTFTSSDPSLLVVSKDPQVPGDVSATPASGGAIYLQALATAGSVIVHVDHPTLGGADYPIDLTSPALTITSANTVIGPGETTTIAVTIVNSDGTACQCLLSPGSQTIPISLHLSDPGVVQITTPATPFTAGAGNYNPPASLKGLLPGTTTISLDTTPLPVFGNSSLTLRVVDRPASLPDVEIGLGLGVLKSLVIPGATPRSGNITLTLADPVNFGLATSANNPPTGQISFPVTSSNIYYFYVIGKGPNVGAVTQLTAAIPGLAPISSTISLVPAGFAWPSGNADVSFQSGNSSNVPFKFSVYALDPATLFPIGSTQFSSKAVQVPVTSSDSSVVKITNLPSFSAGSNTLNFYTTINPGSANLLITQPANFTPPSIRQILPVAVSVPFYPSLDAPLARNLQTTLSFGNAASGPITITSADPSRLLLSTDPNTLGSPSIAALLGKSTIWVQAIGDPGYARINFERPNLPTQFIDVNIGILGAGVNIDTSSVTNTVGVYSTTTASSPVTLNVSVGVVNGYFYGNSRLLPGQSVTVALTTSAPEVGTFSSSSVQITDPNTPVKLTFQPRAPGTTTISTAAIPGFAVNRNAIKLRVDSPAFVAPDVTISRDTLVANNLKWPSTIPAPKTNLTVTITSTDPAKVLLSLNSNSTGTPSITTTLVAGQLDVPQIYLHALSNSGNVAIAIHSAAFADSTFLAKLQDLYFTFNNQPANNAQSVVLQGGPIQFVLGTSSGPKFSTPSLRPGIPDIVVNLTSSNPDVATTQNAQVVFKAGTSSSNATVNLLSTGTTTLSIVPPANYLADPNAAIALTVIPDTLKLNASSIVVGKDTQAQDSVYASGQLRDKPVITITSSDPSRVVLSPDGKALGQASISVPSTGGFPGFYVQALADSGTVTLSISAPGYIATTQTVQLTQIAPYFSQNSVSLVSGAFTPALQIYLGGIDPQSGKVANRNLSIRPGVTLTASVSSADPSIADTKPATLSFTSDQPDQKLAFTAYKAGNTIVTLGPLSNGGSAPASQSILVTVTDPPYQLTVNSVYSLFWRAAQVRLHPNQPTSTTDLSFALVANSFYFSEVSTPYFSRNQVVNLTIPAGQRISKTFYMNADSGSDGFVEFVVPAGPSSNSNYYVVLSPQVIDFAITSPASPAIVPIGTAITATIEPLLFPGALPVPSDALNPGFTSTNVYLNTSIPNVIGFPSQLSVSLGGPTRFQITGNAKGQTLLRIGSQSTANTKGVLDLTVK